MAASTCAKCEKPAVQKCARCQNVVYCDRDCQKQHWSTHKLTCVDIHAEERRVNWMMHVNPRISGNIYIMASHKYATLGPGVVFAEIEETIEEFMKGGNTMHFAHLSFAPAAEVHEFSRSKYNLVLTTQLPELRTTAVVVVYVLKNYHSVMNITPENIIDLETLKNNYPNPDNDWSVLFNM